MILLLLGGHGCHVQGERDRCRKDGNRCLFVCLQLAHLNPPPDDAFVFMRALTCDAHFPRFVSGKMTPLVKTVAKAGQQGMLQCKMAVPWRKPGERGQ